MVLVSQVIRNVHETYISGGANGWGQKRKLPFILSLARDHVTTF